MDLNELETKAKADVGSVESVLKVSENKFVAAVEQYWPQIVAIAVPVLLFGLIVGVMIGRASK